MSSSHRSLKEINILLVGLVKQKPFLQFNIKRCGLIIKFLIEKVNFIFCPPHAFNDRNTKSFFVRHWCLATVKKALHIAKFEKASLQLLIFYYLRNMIILSFLKESIEIPSVIRFNFILDLKTFRSSCETSRTKATNKC